VFWVNTNCICKSSQLQSVLNLVFRTDGSPAIFKLIKNGTFVAANYTKAFTGSYDKHILFISI
jgi:hypothetical protein